MFHTKVVQKIKTHFMFSKSFLKIVPFMRFIHSFSILSNDRSKASSKTIPPHSAI